MLWTKKIKPSVSPEILGHNKDQWRHSVCLCTHLNRLLLSTNVSSVSYLSAAVAVLGTYMSETRDWSSGGRMRVSVLPNRPTTRTRHMIELKCESLNQDCRLSSSDQVVVRNAYRGPKSTGQLIPAFAKRMEVEVGRMNGVTAHYRPCQYTVIGISVTKAAHDFVMQEKDRDPLYFSYLTPQQVFGNQARPDNYFVMWFKSGYIPS
ncbi:hypothetical protein N8I77_007449 [Diaporthe amygdali]|uniref:Uncharacterized protein n=1 Tax=Phomopsis amygdali TaxID=1214568 RepID=A0AAD9W438_PHOAM|nr:hypothetical protein N8I77_007449 [Diaporthe amygdali]